MDFENVIFRTYAELEKTKQKHLRTELYFNIIQLKSANPEFSNVSQSLYQDSKRFIQEYISSVDDRDSGYDLINLEKIHKVVDLQLADTDRYNISSYVTRQLFANGFEKESKSTLNLVKRSKTIMLWNKEFHFSKYANLLFHLTSVSIYSIIATLLVFFAIWSCMLLPAIDESFTLFEVSYEYFSDSFIWNHFLNIIASIFNVTDNQLVKPINNLGLLIIVSMKIFYVIFIVNFLFKKATDLITYN